MIEAPIQRQRLHADERRRQIVEAAFAMIAEAGLERFRTRDVALRVGINSATLHHYFPTKERLIEGVAEHLEGLYRDLRGPDGTDPSDRPALAALRREFADVRFYRIERPDILAVSAEFLLGSARSRAAARTVKALHEHWRRQVEAIVRQGQADGSFGPRIDPVAASMVVLGSLWGATGLLRASDEAFERMCHALEAWLTGNADPARGERNA